MNPYLLWAVGLLLIFLEFYLPGGIMGTLGTLVVLGSIVVFVLQTNSPVAIIFYVTGTIISLAILFKFALWRIRRAKPERSIYSNAHQEGYIAATYDKAAIGKVGTVASDLKPGGHILIEGKKHGAISQSGYLAKGEKVMVIGGEGESLLVKHYKEEKES